MVEHGLGERYRTGLRRALDPRGDVDAVAEQILAVDHNVGQVNADAQIEQAVVVAAQAGQVALNIEAGADRRDRAGEFRQETVAGLGESASGFFLDPGPDHFADPRQARERIGLRRAHLRRIADHIARHDRRKSAFHACSQACPRTRTGNLARRLGRSNNRRA